MALVHLLLLITALTALNTTTNCTDLERQALLTTAVTALNTTTNCTDLERQALLSIKTGISDAATRFSSWNGFACCSWAGVNCTAGHVVKLDLHYPGPLTDIIEISSVSSSLLDLSHLQYLDLSLNNFGGSPIPTFIGSLTHLSYLNLSNAGFGGPIPHHLGNLSHLISLDLSYGYNLAFPTADDLTWLSSLKTLQHLDMSLVNLSNITDWLDIIGTLPSLSVLRLSSTLLPAIPATLHNLNLSSLTVFDISYNDLVSTNIPNWIFKLNNLTNLNLRSNKFGGAIPTTIRNLTKLQILDLSYNSFTGPVPDAIGNLNQLQILDLYHNNFTGPVPDIGNLTNLQKLDLSFNSFTHEIPDTLQSLRSLRYLYLSNNNINGKIPETLGNLCNLIILDASSNNLSYGMSGLIEVLSKCSPARLQYLYMSNNMLKGYLPEHVGDIQSLRVLDLGNNLFTGSIPASIGRLSALNEILLHSNSFVGEMTEVHFSNLANLTILDLSDNSLTVNVSESWIPPFKAAVIRLRSCKLGPSFPTYLQNQTSLSDLDLSGADISSTMPAWFGELCLSNIRLNMSHNQIKGELPASMKCFTLSYLDMSYNRFEGIFPKLDSVFIDLSYNNFSGPIPVAAGGARSLIILRLSHNMLDGSITPSICDTDLLKVVDLSYNELSGELPDCWDSSNLMVVDFSSNRLSGEIPSSMGNLNQLRILHLSNNSLTGEIPLSLQKCTQLVTLDLGNNNLQGSIPSWNGSSLPLLRVLRLRSNVLHGDIPVQLSVLTSLRLLDLADNRLSRVLPPWLGNLIALQTSEQNMSIFGEVADYNTDRYVPSYQDSLFVSAKGVVREYTNLLPLVASIDMSSNILTGEIPDGLTKLHGLIFLNLSDNLLRGCIPVNIGQLEKLESLDMSMNELSGSIPQSITSLNFLATLKLSNNNLSGPIPLGDQMSTFPPLSYSNNVYLCGPPLPKKCSNDEGEDGDGHKPSNDEGEDGDGHDDNSDTILILIMGFAPGFVVGFWVFVGVTMIKSSRRYAYFQYIDRILGY